MEGREGDKHTPLCESLRGLLGGFRSIKTMMEVRVMITTAKLSKQNARERVGRVQ